ncbi:MAG TPA: hypothetical protein VGI02_11375, partial [Actinomycetospora sp.]
FAYHGYPWLIHRLTYRRTNHANLHVRGYKEEGTTTTPFDMVMLNDLDRFHLVMDVIDRVPGLAVRHAALRQQMADERLACHDYTRRHGEDRPDVRDWVWSADGAPGASRPSGATDTDSDFPDDLPEQVRSGPEQHDPLADVREHAAAGRAGPVG